MRKIFTTIGLSLALASIASTSAFAAGELDWESISLSTSGGLEQKIRIDDDGNYSSTTGSTGQITGSDLARLDSRIDAIKEEAHDRFSCAFEFPTILGYSVYLTFQNATDAIVYRKLPGASEECWSGDRLSVELLLEELLSLQNAYAR